MTVALFKLRAGPLRMKTHNTCPDAFEERRSGDCKLLAVRYVI